MKRRITTYSFDASGKVLTLSEEAEFDIAGLLAVVNVTTGQDLYIAGLRGYGYVHVAGNVVALEAATTNMADDDALLVLYEDDAATAVSDAAAHSALGLLATQTTAAAILTKLSSDPATQTTLAAVLAKLSSDPATATLQNVIVSALGSIDGHVDGVEAALAGVATQTTAAAILAKLTSDPSTATLQGAGNTSLSAIATAAGAPADAAWSGSGSGGVVALLKAVFGLLAPVSYTPTTVTLSSGQAAGTSPVLASNSARKGLAIWSPAGSVKDFEWNFAAFTGAGQGARIFAQGGYVWEGARVPTNALYVYGLAAGDKLLVWEA